MCFVGKKKDDLAELRAMEYIQPKPQTIKVAVTGASGNIGYALLFRLASGEMFGKNQRVQIHAYDLPPMLPRVKGVAMELYDCAFPTLEGVLVTDSLERAFDDIDVALLVGSKPRLKGMERKDLIRDNGAIFVQQGKALNEYARDSVKVCVVGNPANTNCLILANNAPDIHLKNFSAMTRLDHDRGIALLAKKAKCHIDDVTHFCIWGNHSSTMFPDITYALIKGKPAMEALKEANPGENIEEWYHKEYIPKVQQRGAAILEARGASSAASAANACLQHSRNWELGSHGKWVSMAIPSDGQYDVKPGLIFSYPVTCENETISIVPKLPELTDFQREKIKLTEKELLDERDTVADLLPN